MTPEGKFKKELKKQLRDLLPGCIITQLDPNDIQGIPDLLILWNDRWASLECKTSEAAHHQPNQDYYVSLMNSMSYSSFIFPENKDVVLNELQQTLRARR